MQQSVIYSLAKYVNGHISYFIFNGGQKLQGKKDLWVDN